MRYPLFLYLNTSMLEGFDLLVFQLGWCINGCRRQPAPSRALDESLFESAFGVFSSFFIYLLQTENLLLIKIVVNS